MAQRVSRPTSARELIEVVEAVPGPKTLVVEESHLAQRVKRALTPYVDRLIICDPKRNHWIAKDEFNDDRSSAHKLAKLFQKPIHRLDRPNALAGVAPQSRRDGSRRTRRVGCEGGGRLRDVEGIPPGALLGESD